MIYWWVGSLGKFDFLYTNFSTKIGIEKVKFSRSGRHVHVRFWRKQPPRLWAVNWVRYIKMKIAEGVLSSPQAWKVAILTTHSRLNFFSFIETCCLCACSMKQTSWLDNVDSFVYIVYCFITREHRALIRTMIIVSIL